MSTLLDEAIKTKGDVSKMPQYLPLSTVQNIETVSAVHQKAQQKGISLPNYKTSTAERLATGAAMAAVQLADVAPALELFGEEAQLGIGGYFGAKEDFIERKKLNIATLQRNLAAQQQNRMQGITAETADSWAFGIGEGLTNFALMYVTGGTASLGAKALLGASAKSAAKWGAAAGIASAIPLENIEQQSDRIKFDEQGNIDTSNITPEWAKKTTGGVATYLTGMGILEAKLGIFKNLTLWEKPIPFKNRLLKNLSVPVTTGLKSFVNEGSTEGLQSLLSSGIQLAEGNIKLSDMPAQIQQAWKEAIIGGLLGGTTGVAVGVNQGNNVKTWLNEEISKVVTDPEECEKVVDAIYESGTIEMTNVISKELELSSELNAKHGAIYDNMQGAIFDAINNAGAFQGVEEAELAQYVSETSKMFANQVLAEANKRGVLIDEVLTAGDIKFENGKIQLKSGGKVIAETPVMQEEVQPEVQTQAAESTKINQEIPFEDTPKYKAKEKQYKSYEKQKKAAAYEILSMATGKSAKWLRMQLGSDSTKKGMVKRREFIENLIAEYASDNITASNGMDARWSGFFADTGVSYDNQEVDGESRLIEQALDAVLNNDFTDPEYIIDKEMYEREQYFGKLIDDITEKFDNAKTLEELGEVWNNEVETLSTRTIKEIGNVLADYYEKAIERVLNGQTGLQNEAKTEDARNRQSTSGTDVRTEEESNGNSISNIGNGSEISENEINPDNKLFQEANKLYQEMQDIDKTGTPYNEPTININGVERSTTNSEGNAIAKTKEAIEHFYKWFGDSKVVDDEGRPLVVYHGSVNTFEIFDKGKASPEGDMGAGFYFTSNEEDADSNYHGGGPDFDNKVARRAEQIQQEKEEEGEDIDYEEAKELAEKELKGEPMQFSVYLKIENPCNADSLLFTDIEDNIDINEEDFETEDEYYEERDYQLQNEIDNILDYAEREFSGVLASYNYDEQRQNIFNIITDAIYAGGINVTGLKQSLNELYLEDENGNMVGNEVLRAIIESLGYDGIIDESVSQKFNMNIPAGTTHYIAFNSTQIKSVDNRGTFDESNPNIYYQSAYHGTPHNFDAFSLDAIGSGEGNQAHGWGLYFAANKEVSEGYRKRLVPLEEEILYEGKSPKHIEFKNGFNNRQLLEAILFRGKQGVLNHLEKNRPFGENTDEIIDYVKNIDETKLEKRTNGQLFEVDIPENDVLLDENKKLSEQSQKVQEALKKLARNTEYKFFIEDWFNKDVTGKQLYNDLAMHINIDNQMAYYPEEKFNPFERTSKLLNQYGIKGITYDGRQDGTSYVIFDDKAINILNKFYQLKGLPKQQQTFRGAYDVSAKAIELFKDADYSTLPHELAHFWLDNMWQFSRSGKASEAYMNNFNGVLDWLGVKDGQINLTRTQQEKFARGYEKYLFNGYAPNGLVQGAFDDYDRWLQKVYKDAKELKVKLDADAIAFFDSMTTGELPEYDVPETQAEIREKNIEQMNKDIETARKFVVEKQEQFTNYDGGNAITSETVPVTTEGEKRQSRAYTNQAAILGIAEELDYNQANIEEQNRLATDFVKNNLDEARQVVNGQKEAPSNILKNAIYNAYLKEMLAIGDNEAYINALRNQSLELTRAGQEIASQRGAIENIFDSGYWIRRIETLKKSKLASQKFGNGLTASEQEQALSKMNNYIKNKVDAVMEDFMDATPEQQKKIAEKLSKEIAAEFKQKPDTTLYQSMREPNELRTRTNAYNYLYRYINGALGLELTRAQSNEIIAKTQAIQKSIETTRNRNGNPSALFFKNISEMEAYANSIEPSPALAILTSTVGRGNMLFSPKTIALNIESNIVNFFTEAITRRLQTGAVGMVVDPQVIKDYLAYSREVFNTSGYQVSSMPTLDPTTQVLSEKMTTTAGNRLVDKVGRFFEQTIFKYGLGAPDLFFKDMTFVDTANLLATKEAKGDSKKATELFKDICLIEPKTAKGKELREIAINEALVATYQNQGNTSDLALGIRNAINKATGSLRAGDLLSPFVKTPANVIGLGFDYSMGGLVALKNIQTIYNDIQNGTFTDTTRKSLRSLARNGIGFFAAMMIASMIDDDDYIPEYALLSPKERELVKLKGGVFNSIKIGNKYVSLDYFGPLAMPLVSYLNARRADNAKDVIWNYFQGSAYQALKLPVVGDIKSLLEGTGRTLTQDANSNIKMVWDAMIDFVASRSIPAIVTDIAKMSDEFERETNNDAKNRLISKLPVLREELPMQYNYGTGRARETQNPITILLAGARVKDEVTSPVIRELNRLDKTNTEEKVNLAKVTKSGKLSGLSDAQKIDVERKFAQRYATEVNNLIQSNYYPTLDNSGKVKEINKIRDKVRYDIRVEYGLEQPPKPKRRYRRRK